MADKKISALTGATTPLAGTEVLPIVQGGATVKVSVDNLTTGKNVAASQFNATSSITAQSTFGIINSKGTTGWAGVWHENTGGSLFVGADDSTGATFGTEAYGSVLSSATKPVYVRINSANTVKFTADGSIAILTSGKGIDFSATSGSGTSELLADYEEGTWTPTAVNMTGTATYTGYYTKIGRMVYIEFYSSNTALTVTAGFTYFTGLPFIPQTGGNNTSGGTFYSVANTGGGFLSTTGSGNVFFDTSATLAAGFGASLMYSV